MIPGSPHAKWSDGTLLLNMPTPCPHHTLSNIPDWCEINPHTFPWCNEHVILGVVGGAGQSVTTEILPELSPWRWPGNKGESQAEGFMHDNVNYNIHELHAEISSQTMKKLWQLDKHEDQGPLFYDWSRYLPMGEDVTNVMFSVIGPRTWLALNRNQAQKMILWNRLSHLLFWLLTSIMPEPAPYESGLKSLFVLYIMLSILWSNIQYIMIFFL